MNFNNYLKEVLAVLKEHYFVIIVFIIVSIILKFITIPFLSLFIMFLLMFCLSKTQDYKEGLVLSKIFQFILYFIFLIIFVLLFSIPATIFLFGYNVVSTTQELAKSPLIQDFVKVGAYVSILFIFAPYRIFDSSANVFKAISYSCSVVINNFLLFLMIAITLIIINLLTLNISSLDYYIYFLAVVLTVSLYRLNVKKQKICEANFKGDINENN